MDETEKLIKLKRILQDWIKTYRNELRKTERKETQEIYSKNIETMTFVLSIIEGL